MLRLFLSLLLSIFLAGCGCLHSYRPNVQQGNIFTAQQVARLRIGMSETDVHKILGQPVLSNTFADNREVFVYQYYPNCGNNEKKIVTLTFSNGQLVNIKNPS